MQFGAIQTSASEILESGSYGGIMKGKTTKSSSVKKYITSSVWIFAYINAYTVCVNNQFDVK